MQVELGLCTAVWHSERQRIRQRRPAIHRSLVHERSVTQNRCIAVLREITALLPKRIAHARDLRPSFVSAEFTCQGLRSRSDYCTFIRGDDAGYPIPMLCRPASTPAGRSVPVLTRLASVEIIHGDAGEARSIVPVNLSWRTHA